MAVADPRPSRIVFLGPPNSGKGTQAALLAVKLGIPAISTGNMLREAVSAGSPLGRQVEDVMNSGLLVSDDLMAKVVKARLALGDAREGFLLDGYPRTLPQVETLDGILRESGQDLDHVVMIDAPEDVLVERASKRLTEEGRDDDNREIVRQRLQEYRDKTEPLVDHYRGRGLLREIDGDQDIALVESSLMEKVTAL